MAYLLVLSQASRQRKSWTALRAALALLFGIVNPPVIDG